MSENIQKHDLDAKALPALLTTVQAADVLQLHSRTVMRMCERGELKAVKLSGTWRINRDALLSAVGLL